MTYFARISEQSSPTDKVSRYDICVSQAAKTMAGVAVDVLRVIETTTLKFLEERLADIQAKIDAVKKIDKGDGI